MASMHSAKTTRAGWIIVAIACVLASPVLATQVETAGAGQCDTRGYNKDIDPRGTNIRAAPNARAPIIGHLPPREPIEPGADDLVGAEFHIIGARDGWLLIRDAHAGSDDKLVFKGPGWISGRLVGFTLGGGVLRDAPDVDAKVIAKLSGELKDGSAYGPDSYEVMAVHGCVSHFVDVTIRLAPSIAPKVKPLRGWNERACSTQVTTCDSAYAPTPFDVPYTEADARSVCIRDVLDLLEGETCTVKTFGDVGAVDGRAFLYAIYAIATTREGVATETRAVVFERRSDGKLRLRLAPDGDNVTFGKPEILRTGSRTLLHIPGSESGTGNFNHEALYLWRDGRWTDVDTDSWPKTLEKRLPAGLGAWKGIFPNYKTLTAFTPLWRKGDSNACPTGGTADIGLAWSQDAIILSSVTIHKPRGNCSE